MIRRLTFSMLTLALTTCLIFGFSNTQVLQAKSQNHHKNNALEQNMKILGSAFKKIRRQARSKTFDASTIQHIQKMQTAALLAMHESPSDIANQKQRVIQYRSQMALTIKKLLDMELAALKGNNDDVAKRVTELYAIMKTGHKQFKHDD